MQHSDREAFLKIFTLLSELYGKVLSKPLVHLYWRVLEPFELRDVQKAFNTHIHNPDGGQFFPKPADILRILEGSGETKALQAWTKVEQAMRRIGIYQSLVFDDPLIHAVLEDMGGWIYFCSMTLGEMPFRANEFQKRYMGFVLKPPTRYPSYCCGLIEAENRKNGYPISPRVLLGNEIKAKQVFLEGEGRALSMQWLEITEQALSIASSPAPALESSKIPITSDAVNLSKNSLELIRRIKNKCLKA